MTIQPNISINFYCVHSPDGIMRPPFTLKALLMSRVYIQDAKEQLAEQLKQPRHSQCYGEMCYQCQSYTVHHNVANHFHSEGVMWAYLCSAVCIFHLVTNAGEIQMSQNDQCPVQCV